MSLSAVGVPPAQIPLTELDAAFAVDILRVISPSSIESPFDAVVIISIVLYCVEPA